jgi:5-methylcytosine-specific restriction endonuclease McrA
MIKIEIPTDIKKKIIETHKEYVKFEIPKRWEDLCTTKIDGKLVKKKERKLLAEALMNKNIIIPSINTLNSGRLKNDNYIKMCIDSDLEQYSYSSEDIFVDKATRDRLKNILLYVIGYKSFHKIKIVKTKTYGDIKWSRHAFVQELNVRVCPYCNRQYITSYYKDGNQYTTADTDHYYPYINYPLLSMNIHNLVPSCQVCNSRMKNQRVKDKRMLHLYPYSDESSVLKFKIPYNTLNELYNFKINDVDINIVVNTRDTIQRTRGDKSIDMFRLVDIYKSHKIEAYDLKNNIRDYSKEAFDTIISKNYEGVFKDYHQFQELAFPFLNKEPGEEPLLKMKQDIYNQITLK